MRILYFCSVNKSMPLEAGVYKKVVAQIKTLRSCGHDVYFACREGASKMQITNSLGKEICFIDLASFRKLKRDSVIADFIRKFVLESNIDCVYSRYGSFSLKLHYLYKELHNDGKLILLEVPTYPLNQRWANLRQSFKSRNYLLTLKLINNYTIGSLGIPFFKRSVDRIINNNGFEKIWGLDVIPINNGIDVSSIPDRPRFYKSSNEIRLMSVANIAHWHGFDRLIRGLAEYYKDSQPKKVYVEIAGPGVEVKLLEELATKLGVNTYIKFLGPKVGKELDELFDKSDLGISVLGVHRVNMKECDSLKAREFCARRLPFITEAAESQYVGKPFAHIVPSDETPINIKDIISFYEKISTNPEILNEMREFAETRCDWKFAMRHVLEYLNNKEKK